MPRNTSPTQTQPQPHITAAQSGWTKFHYTFLDASNQPLGTLKLPTGLTAPTNGWTKDAIPTALQDVVRFTLPTGPFHLTYALAGEPNPPADLIYALHNSSAPTDPLATAFVSGRDRRWELSAGNALYTITPQHTFLQRSFSISYNQTPIGSIHETHRFSLIKRHFTITLPDTLPNELRAFLFFLAVNSAFR
jgi:hypothetical protein